MKLLTTILALAICAAPITAQSETAWGLGNPAVTISGSTLGTFTLEGSANLAKVTDALGFSAGIMYMNVSTTDGLFRAWNVSTRDVAFLPRVTLQLPIGGRRTNTYIGGGIGLHLISVSTDIGREISMDPTSAAVSGPSIDLNFGGGMDYMIGDRVSVGGQADVHMGAFSHVRFGVRAAYSF